MAHTATPAARPDPRTERASPTVLAVVVARDGAPWLKRCLASLGRQTYPRLGVIAVDNGSRDGSGDILAGSLGEERVIRLDRAIGFPDAITRAVRRFSAKPPDYLLILHDDVALAPEAVTHMVRAALRAGAGVVGPKVLDARRPRVLREVGLATDRFSYPYSPLDEDEIDQGQYDSPREVLFVSSAAMLVSRDAWMTTGLFDERLETCHGDLDFCWRVRLAGLPVVVDPRAVVTHRGAATNGERPSWRHAHGRFLGEQARLLALLKNYRLRTLAWLLPLALAQGMASVVGLVVSRRFDEAGQVLAAWGWNVVHLPGTVRRRVRARRARRVGDRAVVRYMAPASARIRRWILQATAPLVATAGPQGLDAAGPRPTLRRRVGRALAANPVAVGWGVALVVSLFAFRHVLFGPMPEGGALPVAPPRAMDLLREFGSGWRSAGFGGPGGALPALVPLGLASFITLGRPDLLLRLVLSAALVLAGISSYRAAMRLTADRLGSVTTAACYTLSGVVMLSLIHI